SIDRLRRVLQRHVTMAALLIQTAESWMVLLEAQQRGERLGNLSEKPLAHRLKIKHIPILRQLGRQRLGGFEALLEAAAFHQLSDALNLKFNGRVNGIGSEVHGFHRIRRARLPAWHSTAWDRLLKLIAELDPQNPRPQRYFRLDELSRRRKHAGIGVAQVLPVELRGPIVLGHPDGSVVSRVAGLLVTQ